MQWVILSSANARAVSLTIRGILIGLIPTAIYFLGLANIQFENQALTLLADQVAEFLFQVGTAITLIVTATGIIRKLATTATGTNEVVQAWKDEE